MDNLNLRSDESVIHTTQRIIVNGVGHEALLTSDRLILVETDSGNPRLSIPFGSIELAVAETNRLREPVIRITFSSPDGSMRGIELIFIFLAAGMNVQNRDKCMTALAELGVPVRLEPHHTGSRPLSRKESMDTGTLDVDSPSGRPAVPEWTIYGMSQTSNKPLPEEPSPPSPVFTIIAIILIAVMVIAAMTMPIPEPHQPKYLSPHTTTKPVVTATPAPAPVVTPRPIATSAPEAPVPTETTPAPAAGPAQYVIPDTGVWVHVAYPGNYSGYISTNGQRQEVDSSGDQLFQLIMSKGMIDSLIEKTDGSVTPLSVEIYKAGALVDLANTTIPRGVVEIHTKI